MTDNSIESSPIIRRITEKDIASMASLVSKRITETGACLMLGIKPESWFKWKCRAKSAGKFAKLLEHAREAKLNACIERIDEAGEDYEITIETTQGTKTIERKGDWRAKAWMAERVLAPERFGDRQQVTANQSTVIIGDSALQQILDKVYKQPKQVIDVQPIKQISDDCQNDTRQVVD